MELWNLFEILTRWLRDDADLGNFQFTSIQLNKNHASAVHRDTANMGPSVAKTLGDFTGGILHWLPVDDGRLHTDEIPISSMVPMDTTRFAEFNGNHAHGVSDFEGERWSVIFFTASTVKRGSGQAIQALVDCGAWKRDHPQSGYKRRWGEV